MKEPLTLVTSPAQGQTERCHQQKLDLSQLGSLRVFKHSQIVGNFRDAVHNINSAVPVNLAYHVGKSVVKYLKNLP